MSLCFSATHRMKRTIYTIFEYHPLLDSSNMSVCDYKRIAADIKVISHTHASSLELTFACFMLFQEHYERFDGFVILHGTDTMAYTASALSFLLEFLGKPVILTGSQVRYNPITNQITKSSFSTLSIINNHTNYF